MHTHRYKHTHIVIHEIVQGDSPPELMIYVFVLFSIVVV